MKKSELKQLIKEEILKVLNENIIRIGNVYYKVSRSERPKEGDWILKFKQANQWDFKSGDLKEKDYQYFLTKLPSEALLNPEDLKIIATNDNELIQNGIPSLTLTEKKSSSISYKDKKYYIEDPIEKEKVFAYSDPELKNLVKINGKTLMFKVKDIKDMLIKEGFEYDMMLANINNVIYEVQDKEGFKLFRGTKTECIDYIKENSKYRYYKDKT